MGTSPISTLVISIGLVGAPTSASDPWLTVDQTVQKQIDNGTLTDITLEIYSADHKLIHRFANGASDPAVTMPVFSASKWISTAVLMRLTEQNILTLDDHWNGVTLRQLLTMTSGVQEDHACYQDPETTLEACALSILQSAASAAPGKEFRYGDAHLSVAAQMAVFAAGKSWQTLFEELIARPIGMRGDTKFYAKPKTMKGSQNPRPAAGLRISYNDYLKFLRMIVDKGVFQGRRVLSEDSVLAMETNQLAPEVNVTKSAFQDLKLPARYGFGLWVETNSDGESTASSPGFYGFYPWLDRPKGYYAVLMANEAKPVFNEVIEMVAHLKPQIEMALQNRNSPTQTTSSP